MASDLIKRDNTSTAAAALPEALWVPPYGWVLLPKPACIREGIRPTGGELYTWDPRAIDVRVMRVIGGGRG